jgi:hypothetical protein
MKTKYTTSQGKHCTYLLRNGFHVAKTSDNFRGDRSELERIAAQLNRAAALETSHTDLMEAVRQLLWAYKDQSYSTSIYDSSKVILQKAESLTQKEKGASTGV